MSLNNRISIRDTYEARGAVVDHQVVTSFRTAARPEVTTDTIIMVPIKPDGDYTNELVGEAEVEERVNSESCDHYVIALLFSDSSSSCDYGQCLRPIIRKPDRRTL